MNCKNCGFQLNENDQFCKNCGTPVNNVSVQNNNESLNVQQESNYRQPNMQQSAVQQPSWAGGYNGQAINQASRNSNTKFIIIGIIVAVVVVGAIIGGAVAFSVLGNKKINNSEPKESEVTLVNNDNNNKNSNYTVKFKGFTFKIPTNFVYEVQTNALLLGDEEGTWASYVEIVEGSYNQLLSRKGQFQSTYQSMGYTSSAAVEKTIGGMPFITIEISKSGTNTLLGLTKANSMNLFGVTIYNIDNEYDYKLLETISGILSATEYNGTTNSMSTYEKLDLSKIAALAK